MLHRVWKFQGIIEDKPTIFWQENYVNENNFMTQQIFSLHLLPTQIHHTTTDMNKHMEEIYNLSNSFNNHMNCLAF